MIGKLTKDHGGRHVRTLAWVTDLHLDFLEPRQVDAFLSSLARLEVDALLIGGDISEAPDVHLMLNQLDNCFQRPIYFVLGNHDFYRGSIVGVRAKVTALCEACPRLCWLAR